MPILEWHSGIPIRMEKPPIYRALGRVFRRVWEIITLDGKLLWPNLTNPKWETKKGQSVMIT